MPPPAAVCYHARMSAEGVARCTCDPRFVSVHPAHNRAWGRLPGPGHALVAFYPDGAAAQPEAERLIARRLRRGYTVAGQRGLTDIAVGLVQRICTQTRGGQHQVHSHTLTFRAYTLLGATVYQGLGPVGSVRM